MPAFHPLSARRTPAPDPARRRTRRRAVAAGALTAVLAAAGLAPKSASASAPGGDYCAAHLATEAAVNAGDPAAIGPAVEALFAAAPAEIADAVHTMVDNVPELGPPAPEFITSYNTVVAWIKDHCGFADLQVLAQDFSYGGIPAEVPAGPTVVELVNEGTELHEIILIKRAEGFDAPVEEVLAMLAEEEGPDAGEGTAPPEGDAGEAPIAFLGAAYSFPGESGFAVFDLQPGSYIGVCFVPVGTTPEAFEHMMSMPMGSEPSEAPAGTEPPPHFTEGMVVEFTVTG